jgi:hypothetical protein
MPPLSDKDVALELLNWIEQLHRRIAALESALQLLVGTRYNWQALAKSAEDSKVSKDVLHARFEPFRELVLHAPDLNSAVRKILEDSERIDPSETDQD